MRTRLIVLATVLVLLGLGGVAGVYFYDQGKKDLIAQGVKVNGVPIGGMTRAAAERKLSATLLEPLDRPIKVRYKDRTFTLTQQAAAIGIDIRGSVEGKQAGVALMTHPGNFRFPEPLRIHPTMPYMVYTPQFLGDWEIGPATPHQSRYRFVVHDGQLSAEALDRIWQDFAHPLVAVAE